MSRAAVIAWALGLALAAPAMAAEITGSARVIDGDTLDMAGTRIRLWGIDVPETRQNCEGRDGQTYECGRDSRAVMMELTRDRGCDMRSARPGPLRPGRRGVPNRSRRHQRGDRAPGLGCRLATLQSGRLQPRAGSGST